MQSPQEQNQTNYTPGDISSPTSKDQLHHNMPFLQTPQTHVEGEQEEGKSKWKTHLSKNDWTTQEAA